MAYTELASEETINQVVLALKERNVEGMVVATGADALAKIKELIPAGASVMNGASRTLEEIGFIDYLKSGAHDWNNLHAAILAESDKTKQAKLRKEAVLADYYLGSVHGLAVTGELVIASNTGSQLPHIVFTSPNLILVVSTQKIVPTLEAARERLREHALPLEDKHMMELYRIHTALSKELIFHRESPFLGRKVRVLLVKEKLGF